MTTIERIQIQVTQQFGNDIGMAVFMALDRFKPNEIERAAYGSRAVKALETMQTE